MEASTPTPAAPSIPDSPALMVEKVTWNRLVEQLLAAGAFGKTDAQDRVLMAALVKWGEAFAEFRIECALEDMAEEAANPEGM